MKVHAYMKVKEAWSRNGSAVFGSSFGTVASSQALRGGRAIHENGNAAETRQSSGDLDKYGRLFLFIADQDRKTRLTGVDAMKSHIFAAKNAGDVIKSSLVPN